jgi:hypothetical protein
METQPDFRELLALFNAHHVEYMIVGGYALAFHGAPRFTGDLDLLVKPDAANAQRILTEGRGGPGRARGSVTPRAHLAPNMYNSGVANKALPPTPYSLHSSLAAASRRA